MCVDAALVQALLQQLFVVTYLLLDKCNTGVMKQAQAVAIVLHILAEIKMFGQCHGDIAGL